jgi:cyclic pyranopterin phosphate synthase
MSGTAGTPRDGAKPRLTHIDEHGKAHMVDVTGKDVTRRVAGVQAAKLTSTLIPLCHPLLIDRSVVDVAVVDGGVAVRAVTTVAGRTGVEIEALTACAVASLVLIQTFFDHDPETSVEGLTVWHKSGGRSGTWERDGQNDGVRLVEK